MSDILLASDLCFQISRSFSPQATYGLKQFGNLHLWVKLKPFFFSLYLIPPEIGDLGSVQPHQGKKDCLSTYTEISKYTGEL